MRRSMYSAPSAVDRRTASKGLLDELAESHGELHGVTSKVQK
jgi:hypothetical protein